MVRSAALVLAVLALVAACSACGGGDGSVDARPPDAGDPADADPDGCTGQTTEFTGELIDFDSTEEAFLGVFDAVFTLRGEASCTATTAPNGRFILQAPNDRRAVFDVDAPGDYLDGIWPVGDSFGSEVSSRALSAADLTGLGVTVDPTRAQIVLTQSDLDPYALEVSGDQGPTFTTADGAAWTAGNDQRYVLYTNVAIGSGVLTLIDSRAITVTLGDLRVEAGKVSYITTAQFPE